MTSFAMPLLRNGVSGSSGSGGHRPGSSASAEPGLGGPPPSEPKTPGAARTAQDREFLPAALEIIETPPSPARVALMLTICALVLTTLAWLCLATLEIHAVAMGKVQPSGRTKIVQPSEPGRVSAIRVENGTHVTAGDILIELDATQSGADRAALERVLASVQSEIEARRAALDWAGGGASSVPPSLSPSVSKESLLVGAEVARLTMALDNIAAQRGETNARRTRLWASIEARRKLLDLLQERVNSRQTLDQSGQGYRAKVIDALETQQRETAVLVSDQGQLAEAEAQLVSLESKRRETIAGFIADQNRLLLDAERKRDQAAQDLVKARSRDERTDLRAPVTGIVQQLTATTVGQVVQAGEPLLSIVPKDAPIEVEALVANKDIGFIEAGQPVVVKIDAFPFTRYGTITGRLTKVSRDAVDQRTNPVTSDALGAHKASGGGTGSVQGLVFPVTVALDRTAIGVGKAEIALVAGMSATVEIKTGERRAIDFLLSPVSEVISSSGKER